MRCFLSLFLLLLTSCSTIQVNKSYVIVKDYGILGLLENYHYEKSKDLIIGKVRIYDDEVKVVKTTNRIPIRDSLRFGIEFEFINIPEDEFIYTELHHPPMITPSGESISLQKHMMRSNRTASGYGFDNNYEKVEGIWTFKFYYNNELILSKEFEVYFESKIQQDAEVN